MTKDIFEYIRFLLPNHKCVTIPNFGAFILNKEDCATFKAEDTIIPTSYSITFNSRLQHDDGTLTSYIQTTTNNPYEVISKELSVTIKNLRAQLLISKKISCGPLGTIELIDGTLVFTQTPNFISPSHYGLTAVKLASIDSISTTIEKTNKTISFRKGTIVAAASAAVIFLLALPSNRITDTKIVEGQQAGYLKSLVSVIEGDKELIYEQPIIVDIETNKIETPNPIKPTVKIIEQYEEVKLESNSTTSKSTLTDNNKKDGSGRTYYLIIGGESSAKTANRTLDSFKREGFETAQILESKERYRIYLETFQDKHEAEKAIIQFRKNNPKYEAAWIHSRKN